MIEYIYNVIKATSGEDVVLCAEITEDTGECIVTPCQLMLHDNKNMIACVDGMLIDGLWNFIIPADITTNLTGKYWYCICTGSRSLCFKQPIYLV